MAIKALTESALALFGIANLAGPCLSQTGPGIEDWVSKLGALGLCGFMVLQNYRQSDNMAKVLKAKDDQVISLTQQYLEASQRHTDAINAISGALRNRPCIVGDRRFDEQAPDSK